MAKLTLAAAARMAGVDRSTIFRAIKSHKLTVHIGKDKRRTIDSAEVLRVYGSPDDAMPVASLGRAPRGKGGADQADVVAVLREQCKDLRAERDRLARELADAHNKLWELQSRQNPKQIEGPTESPTLAGLMSSVSRFFGRTEH